jgi:hypothetical protein
MTQQDFPLVPNATAVAATVNQLWLPSISEVSAVVVSILGAIYLLLQIIVYVRTNFLKKPDTPNGQ